MICVLLAASGVVAAGLPADAAAKPEHTATAGLKGRLIHDRFDESKVFPGTIRAYSVYVPFRGGNTYPMLIRKFEPRPIRVFLQDGRNDLNIAGGDWWTANQEMERALKFCGYEVEHAWGDGGHDGKQANEIFPDVMRWLWKDWPSPVKAGAGSNHHRSLLLPGQPWTRVAEGCQGATGPAAAAGAEQILAYDAEGRAAVIAAGIRGHGVIVGPDGRIYVTGVCFGGADFDTLFATCGDRVYRRKLKVRGACAFHGPVGPGQIGL